MKSSPESEKEKESSRSVFSTSFVLICWWAMANDAWRTLSHWPRNRMSSRIYENEFEHNIFFALNVCIEERMRCADLPKVWILLALFHSLQFHVTLLFLSLHKRLIIGGSDPKHGLLFLHTNTGDPLEIHDVTRTIRTFLTRQDPEQSFISTITLRASFKTAMIANLRRNKNFWGFTEDKFLRC